MSAGILKIFYLSNANNYHTKKWAGYFVSNGYDVHVASLEEPSAETVNSCPDVAFHWLRNGSKRQGSDLQKLGYFAAVPQVRRLIEELEPDIVHAHYASSYGLVCSLAYRQPYYLSVWGSDVYEFPQKSPLHRAVVKYSLKKAAWLMSTSRAMAIEASKYTDKSFAITPFGVDMELFCPLPEGEVRHEPGAFVVGTVKALEKKYSIGTLLRGCALLQGRRPDLNLRVRIAGKGTMETELKGLAAELGIASRVEWLGFIPQSQAAKEWARFDVGVIVSVSESESFGVSAVEAQASGTPLIISDIPGLMEACDGGRTASVVPRGNADALADELEALADDSNRRERMAREGREYVAGTYELKQCFEHVDEIYRANLGGGAR